MSGELIKGPLQEAEVLRDGGSEIASFGFKWLISGSLVFNYRSGFSSD